VSGDLRPTEGIDVKRPSASVEPRAARAKGGRIAKAAQTSCFTLEINGRPVLTLSAASLRSARVRIGEAWFIEELERMRSGGHPVLSPDDKCLVRPATPEEAATLDLERAIDRIRGEDVKYAFAFLIRIDLEPN
jgi:hypothetical protein